MNESLTAERITRATVDVNAFSEALRKVHVVLKKSSFPVFEGVHIRFSGGRCILTTTDMNTWMTTEIPAMGGNFSFVLPRSRDVERACRHSDGMLTLELTENNGSKNKDRFIRLTCGPRNGEFDIFPAGDYPETPQVDGEVLFHANSARLLERIRRVSYAALKPDPSVNERAICVDFSGSRVCALDGFRAAWDDGGPDIPIPFMVHAEPLHYLKAFGNREVEFRRAKLWLSVTDGTTTILFRTVECDPFHLDSAIPKSYLEEFSVSPKELLTELEYLKAVTPASNKLYVYLRGNELFTLSKGRRYSTALEINRVDAKTRGFNLNYLTDAARQFKKETRVTVKISGIYSPLVMEAEARGDRALVLPIRVKADAVA